MAFNRSQSLGLVCPWYLILWLSCNTCHSWKAKGSLLHVFCLDIFKCNPSFPAVEILLDFQGSSKCCLSCDALLNASTSQLCLPPLELNAFPWSWYFFSYLIFAFNNHAWNLFLESKLMVTYCKSLKAESKFHLLLYPILSEPQCQGSKTVPFI